MARSSRDRVTIDLRGIADAAVFEVGPAFANETPKGQLTVADGGALQVERLHHLRVQLAELRQHIGPEPQA